MEREKMMDALAKAYEDIYGEYQTLSELASKLLHDGEDAAYKAISRRAQSRLHMLDGMQIAAAALGISLDELLERTKQKEVQA